MAVHKAIRTNPPAQPRPQQARTGLAGDPGPRPQRAKTARTAIPDGAKAAQSGNPGVAQQAKTEPGRPRPDRQRKADIFEVLRRLNRGYGVALDALDKLEAKARRIFPTGLLHGYRNRAEVLRAETNRDLLRIIAGREDQDAEHFGGLPGETGARPHQPK
jgi:hypothetical protein